MAAEAQNATLEFILVNHPLDCPVCDKGGECPLQDLTFRYGPGSTRMTFAKRTFEKPIPISPTIALDRERCILCYRCTRFSERVAEDGQLVAVERGSASMIATFGDEPYRGAVLRQRDRALPGRRADLDAVPLRGAPVGDPERPDRLRPLPGRLQHQRHDARGQGQADPLAQPPRGRRGLALRQGPLRLLAPPAPATGSRIRSRRTPTAASSRSTGTTRSTRPRSCSATAGPAIVTALSGSETVEQAYGLGRLLRVRARRARRRAARGDPRRARLLPRAALVDPRRRNRRRPLRRAGRRARAGRRPLDQGRPPERRLDPHRAARRAGRERRPDHRRRRDAPAWTRPAS